MDAETLERLLVDRALGELPVDVEALLADYLARDPAAARLASTLQDAARLASQVLHRPMAETLPPFPTQRVLGVQRAQRHWRVLRPVSALAACLAFGVWVGAVVLPGVRGTPRSDAVEVGAPAPKRVLATEEPTSESFWSARHLYGRAMAGPGGRSVRLIWDSPLTEPRIGGAV